MSKPPGRVGRRQKASDASDAATMQLDDFLVVEVESARSVAHTMVQRCATEVELVGMGRPAASP